MLSRRTEAGTGESRLQLRLTLLSGRRARTLILPPLALAILGGLLPLAGLIFLGATCYFIFHDDLLAGLTRRQIAMQYDYEDRLARLRHEIVNLTQSAKINEAQLADRVGALSRQEGQLENRTILVAALAERMKALRGAAGTAKSAPPISIAPPSPQAFAPQPETPYVPSAIFAPPRTMPQFSAPKPQPEGFELRLDDVHGPVHGAAAPASGTGAGSPLSPLGFDPQLPLTQKLDHLARRETRLDHLQLALLSDLQKPAKQISAKLRSVLHATGLDVDELHVPAHRPAVDEGGPFVPLPTNSPDGAAFVRAATDAQAAIASAERLHLIATHVPLAAPLPGPLEVTSPFGPRIDPFLGRPAMHTGVDLRDDYGAPVMATADGTVVLAGADGGYGNMVEIDHGNGLSTRYAHLSSISVRPGQKVKAGAIVGRIGETGRATGPHLHYETRIDGQPVNPERFLRAGLLLRTARNGAEL